MKEIILVASGKLPPGGNMPDDFFTLQKVAGRWTEKKIRKVAKR